MEALNSIRSTPIPENNPKLSSLLPTYLADQDLAEVTKENYEIILNQFFRYLEENEISCPSHADLISYKKNLCETHTAGSVNLHLSVIRSFFSWTQFYHIFPNITYNIKSVRSSKTPRRMALSSEQVRAVLENIDTSTLCGAQKYAVVALASTAGLRIAEIAGLDVGDLMVVRNRPGLQVKGKGHICKDQLVALGEVTAAAIRRALSFRDNPRPAEPMFITTSNRNRGSRFTSKGIGQLLKNILTENNFTGTGYTAHSFRHTACCLALEVTDSDLVSVKSYMRHQNISTTLIYSAHDQVLKSNISDSVESLIF